MAQAAPGTYLHDIPSIHATNPTIPAILGNMDMNRGIQAGLPVDPQNLVNAKSVAKALPFIHQSGVDNRVTAAVVESAKLRANAVEAAHAMAMYTPIDLAQTLVNLTNEVRAGFAQVRAEVTQVRAELRAEVAQVNQRLDVITAISQNNRILSRNLQNPTLQRVSPLQKTVPGDGVALATAIYGNVPNLQHLLVPPAAAPNVGSTPPNFINNVAAYQRADIINLIVFYNDDFGIVVGDPVSECVEKFHRFLTTY